MEPEDPQVPIPTEAAEVKRPVDPNIEHPTLHSSETATTTAVLNEDRIELTRDMSINPADVLSGRGKQAFNHVGNRYFREAVARSLEEYMLKQSRFEKSLVVQNIVDEIHGRGGRFLKQDSRTGRYTIELTTTQSRDKVGHAIRDAANLYSTKQNLPRRPPPQQQQQQQQQEQGRSVPARPDAPPLDANAADRRTASGKRRRQQQPQQQYPQEELLGSSSSSTLSVVGDNNNNNNNNNNATPISARDSLSIHNPIVLPFPSPIDYSSIFPQQQQGQSYYYTDPLSPNTSNTMHRFDPLDGTAAFSTQQVPQPTTLYQMDPQMYNRRQQMFQLPQLPLQQQHEHQQQLQRGSDPVYTNYPSQQLAMYSMPVASQQQQPQSTRQPTAETRPTQLQHPVADQGTTPSPPQYWIPYKRPSLDFTEYVNQDQRPDVGISSFDSYTQMLFQEQQERFYREYQMGRNQPANFQTRPRQLQNDDYFLDAIDSVLGPMDNNSNTNNNNNHSDNDGLPTQPSVLPALTSDGIMRLERRQGSSTQNVGRRLDEPSARPDDSLEEHKRTSSIDPSSTNRSGSSE